MRWPFRALANAKSMPGATLLRARDAGLLDHLAEPGDLRAHERRELLDRRIVHRDPRGAGVFGPDLGEVDDRFDLGVQACNDVLRRAGRRHDHLPGYEVEA